MEDVAGQTLRVHSNEDALVRVVNVAKDESDVLMVIDVVAITDHAPHTVVGRQSRFCNPVDESLRAQTMSNELRDSDECQLVLSRKSLELRPFRRSAVIIQNFADDLRVHP